MIIPIHHDAHITERAFPGAIFCFVRVQWKIRIHHVLDLHQDLLTRSSNLMLIPVRLIVSDVIVTGLVFQLSQIGQRASMLRGCTLY